MHITDPPIVIVVPQSKNVMSGQNCCLPVTVRTIHKLLSSIKLCTSFQLSFVHYINIYSRIVIQLNMYVKIITSSGFKSTSLTDFGQGQLRVRFRFGRLWPILEIFRKLYLFTGSCRLLRRLFDYARGSTQNEKNKNKKLKIEAEFMTSVSYRPKAKRTTPTAFPVPSVA